MSIELETWCTRLLSALFNGTYQGFLVAGLVWLGLWVLPRTNAASRHAVALVALLIVALLPCLHFVLPGGVLPSRAVDRVDRADLAPGEPTAKPIRLQGGSDGRGVMREVATTESGYRRRAVGTRDARWRKPGGEETWGMDGARGLLHGEGGAWSRRGVEPTRVWRDSAYGKEAGWEVATTGEADEVEETVDRGGGFWRWVNGGRTWLNRDWSSEVPWRVTAALVVLWALIAGARLTWLVLQCGQLRVMKRRGEVATAELTEAFYEVGREVGLRRAARLLLIPGNSPPMAVGFFSPAVLLSREFVASAEVTELRQVLRHEVAHLGRWDDWANLVQRVVQAVFFYHPGVWWLARALVLEREVACDDHVLASGSTRRGYALFLTETAGRIQGRQRVAALAGWGNNSQLKHRITMILDKERNSSTGLAGARVTGLTTAVVLAAMLALEAGPRLALAGEISTGEALADVVAVNEQGGGAVAPSASVDDSAEAVHTISVSGSRQVVRSGGSAGTSVVRAESGPRPKPVPAPAAVRVEVPAPAAPPAPVALPSSGVRPAPVVPELERAIPVEVRVEVEEDEESIEGRLARLEQMMDSLLAGKTGSYDEEWEGHENLNWNELRVHPSVEVKVKAKEKEIMDRAREEGHERMLSEEQIAVIEREAREGVKRSEWDVQRHMREMARVEDQRRRAAELAQRDLGRALARQRPLEVERQALESQRAALEQQLRAIEEQLNEMEGERERIESELEQRERDLDVFGDSEDASDEQ